MKVNLSSWALVIKKVIIKTLKYGLYAIAMFLAMNDKVGFCTQEELPKPKL